MSIIGSQPESFAGPKSSTNRTADQARQPIGKAFGLASAAIFLFLMTFAIAISMAGVSMGRQLVGAIILGTMLMLAVGAVTGIVALVFRGKPADRGTVILGIIGLALNGIFFLGLLLIMLLGMIATMFALHRDPVAAVPQQQSPTVVYQPLPPRTAPAYVPYHRTYTSPPRR
jgi:hypothetical protein